MKKHYFYLILCLLTGCAQIPVTKLQTVNQLQNWQLNGAISIAQNQKVQMASLSWRQHEQNYTISLYGPLGFGAIKITGQPGLVTLIQASQAPTSASSPEALMQQELGWSLPLSNLFYWMRGLPAPHSAAQTIYDNQHHLVALQQQHWTIHYLQYMNVNGLILPSKMQFNDDNISVRIVIKNWQAL